MAEIKELWAEKYRPKTLDGYVFKDQAQRQQVEAWIKDKSIPNLLFSGPAGVGKTTMAKMLIHQLRVDGCDVLYVNASRENGIGFIRDKIHPFVQTMPFGEFKVVLLDECLDEHTLVHVLRDGTVQKIPIKELKDETDLVKSFDVESKKIVWRSFTLHDKGIKQVFEIEFENGEKVVCTDTHKWYAEDEFGNVVVVNTKNLKDHILTI